MITYRANTTAAYEGTAGRSTVLAGQALAANLESKSVILNLWKIREERFGAYKLTTVTISDVLGTSRVAEGVDRKSV